LVLTAGQRHDSKVAVELLKGVPAQAVIADKAYDLLSMRKTVVWRW
jgi:IS5 family transposase